MSLNNINQLIFVRVVGCLLFKVRTGCFNKSSFGFKLLTFRRNIKLSSSLPQWRRKRYVNPMRCLSHTTQLRWQQFMFQCRENLKCSLEYILLEIVNIMCRRLMSTCLSPTGWNYVHHCSMHQRIGTRYKHHDFRINHLSVNFTCFKIST
jgi:hypothetical protein